MESACAGFDCSYSSWEEVEIPSGVSLPIIMDEVLRHLNLPLSNGSHPPASSPNHFPFSAFKNLADWQADFVCLSYVQILAKHGPQIIIHHLEHLCPMLVTLCQNLRSSVCKNALLAVAYLARGIPFPYFSPYVSPFIPILLARSLSDKRFISDSAWLACTTIAGPYAASEATVSVIMHVSQQHKNSSVFVSKCAELLKLAIKSILAPPPLVYLSNSPPPCSSPSYPSPSVASSLLMSSSDTTDTTPETASPSSTDSANYRTRQAPPQDNFSDVASMRLYHHHRAATGASQRAQMGGRGHAPLSPDPAGARRQQSGAARSSSSPHLPNSTRGGGGSPGGACVGRGSVFLRGIGSILSSYLTERLPATKIAARQTISLLISYYGEEHVKHCLLLNGNVDVHCGASQGGAMGSAGLSRVPQGPGREALLRAISDAAAAVTKQEQQQQRATVTNSSSNRPVKNTVAAPSHYGANATPTSSSSRVSSVRAAPQPAAYVHFPQGAASRGAAAPGAKPSSVVPQTNIGNTAFRRPLQLPHTMMPDGSRMAYPHHTPPSYYGQ
eukprot:GHVS01097401.1.p1 GENE.GHVS01097401.1~~GHVS01097401.1.p1  ORF type:complete len:556 (+),score=88.90 GHVS01097401.1:438-2105(+)